MRKDEIYLIKVEYKECTLLKIGYTNNFNRRLDGYTTHNPLFVLLKKREGSHALEIYMHKKFKEFRYKDSKEWYYYNEYIVSKFDTIEIEAEISEDQRISELLDQCERFNDEKERNKALIFIEKYKDTTILFAERLKSFCENQEYTLEEKKVLSNCISPNRLGRYYNNLGQERIKALGYKTNDIRLEIANNSIPKEIIISKLQEIFNVGKKYKRSYIKSKIKEVYKEIGLKKTAKATDLKEYYNVKSLKITDPVTKTRDHGYEILGIK